MDISEFWRCLCKIVDEQNAIFYSKRFLPLDAVFYNNLLNYEALAFFAYSTGLNWHERINAELWSGVTSPEVDTFSVVLNAALAKLPRFTMNNGTVFRGYRTENLAAFISRYPVGAIAAFPGFTSASFKQESAFGGNILFIIRALTARAIWYVSANFGEFEVLIPAGRTFRVLHVEIQNDRAVVTLEELP